MSAVLDPEGKRDMAAEMISGARAMLVKWLTQDGAVLPGQAPEELAEQIMMSHLIGLAFERGGDRMLGMLAAVVLDQINTIRASTP